MKAISVKQPWANMIAAGEKTIETRTWPTEYRGPLLIVSSKEPRIEPAGCAVAIVRLIDCRPMTRRDERAACCRTYENAFAWVFEEIRAVTPIAIRGQLGVFEVEVDEEKLARLR